MNTTTVKPASVRTSRGIRVKDDIGETVIPGSPPAAIPIAVITIDEAIQQRASMDAELVMEYQARIGEWIDKAPVTVYGADGVYWLADGFHRIAAAQCAGLNEIPAVIRPGARRDALLYAIGANATHGKPRTNADKRRAVETLLSDEEWSSRSDRWIAETAKVSPPLIAKVRAESTVNIYSSPTDTDQLETLPVVHVDAEPIDAQLPPPIERRAVIFNNGSDEAFSGIRSARKAEPTPKEATPTPTPKSLQPLAPAPQKRIGRDGKARSISAPVELTPGEKSAKTRAHNRGWENKKYEIERTLRIGADKYGREKMIAFLKERLAAMEKELEA